MPNASVFLDFLDVLKFHMYLHYFSKFQAINGSQYVDPMTTQGGQLRTLNSTPLMMTMTAGKGPRPHITLNPYSNQLVGNLKFERI